MMYFRKLPCSVLSIIMLAGCSSGTASATASSTSSGSASAASASDNSGTVTIAMDADLNTMDYEVATDGGSFTLQEMCMAGLVQIDENGQPQPDLAESWEISEDGMTYTFHLREGLTWSDGTPLTAADFVFGWQRLVDPDLASEYNFLETTIGVVNASEVINGEVDKSELGVEAPDDTTFVVHLSQPCGFMMSLMGFPLLFPLNEAFYESEGDSYAQSINDLLYCGPYTMTEWQTGNQYTFTKNPDYWDADHTQVETVVFKFLQDSQSAMLEYQSGNIDVVQLSSEQVDAYKGTEGFTQLLAAYSWRLDYNYENELLQNKDLREAISKALDRTAIAENVLKDGSIAAKGFIPEQFAYGTDGTDYRETAGNLIVEDVSEAQAAYERAKEALGDDVTLTLLYEDSEACKAVAENLQQQLETNLPGITINMDCRPKKTRLELMNSHDYEIGLTRWGPDYADPQTYLDLYKSDQPGYTGSYSNEEYNAVMDKAETGEDAANAEARWADLIEAEKILMDDYAICPIYQNGRAMMINPEIGGIYFLMVGGAPYRHMYFKK